MTDMLLECRDLVKTFRMGAARRRTVEALRGVNLAVRRGDVYGFLGENGAGKTTTVRCMIGLTRPTDGGVVIFGERNPRPENLFRRLSYSPEESNFFNGFTGRELMTIYGRMYGMDTKKLPARTDEVLAAVGLTEAADRRISGYSKGMRQRVGLAQAILPDPEVIILDEPARGLDPIGRRNFRDVINAYAARGTTFFINSHTLSEVERNCNRIGIIKKGQVVRELCPDDLSVSEGLEIRYSASSPLPGSVRADMHFSLHVQNEHALAEATAQIADRDGRVESVKRYKLSLEDYFIQVVKDGEEAKS